MITSGLCVSAKRDILRGVHQPGDIYKIALYGSQANLSFLTTEKYTSEGEVVAKGYVAGGKELQGYYCEVDGTVAFLGWDYDPVWKNTKITAHGAMIYNSSKDDAALAVFEFPEPVISTNGNFRVEMPARSAETAVVWVA